MKKILLLIGLCCSLATRAQDMKTLFVNLPDSLSPLLTKVNRQDFGDFLDSGMKAQVRNRFGNTSEMKELTDDYLNVDITPASNTRMKLLPVNDSVKVICVIHTYSAPAADSDIRFYDTAWRELPASRFVTPPAEDEFYLVPADSLKADELKRLRGTADMYLLKAEVNAKDRCLNFTYTTPDYLDSETAEKLRPYLGGKPVTYRWSDGKFRKP